ncbi:MAG: hypothetical protein ABI416_12085 [Ginsengibacter sp.]
MTEENFLQHLRKKIVLNPGEAIEKTSFNFIDVHDFNDMFVR